jgi:hypothetical protein
MTIGARVIDLCDAVVRNADGGVSQRCCVTHA